MEVPVTLGALSILLEFLISHFMMTMRTLYDGKKLAINGITPPDEQDTSSKRYPEFIS